VGPV
jgi:hypothetical protein